MNVLKINLIIVLIAGAMSTASFTMEVPSNRGGGYKLSKQERMAKKQAQKEARKSAEFVDASTGESPRGSAIGENLDVKMPESWVCSESPQKRGVISEDIPASNLLRENSSSSVTDDPVVGTGLAPQPVIPPAPNPPLIAQNRVSAVNFKCRPNAEYPLSHVSPSSVTYDSPARTTLPVVVLPNSEDVDALRREASRRHDRSHDSVLKKIKRNKLNIVAAIVAVGELVDWAQAYAKTDKEALKGKGLLEKAKIVGQKTYTLKAICGAAQLTKKGMNLGAQACADLKQKAQTFLNKKPA